jgi:hypothetical protein
MPVETKEDPIYFTMKMPEWFMNLDGEEKIRVVEKLAKGSNETHELTEDELLALLPAVGG